MRIEAAELFVFVERLEAMVERAEQSLELCLEVKDAAMGQARWPSADRHTYSEHWQ